MIQINNVSKHYGRFQVLKACSLNVSNGEVVVICGPSGSGKSTLITLVNGLEPFDSGEIMVEGRALSDVRNMSAFRARIGMVFQHF